MISQNISEWLEELRLKVLNDDDKILFQEACNCFENGSYRSAYIMAWITLIESLKRKISFLASLEDARSVQAETEIIALESLGKSSDRLIFEKAKECEILNDTDYPTVSFFWTQRCLFAHPYNHVPTVDELKHIFSQILIISLEQETMFGMKYIDQLIPLLEKSHITGKGYNEISQYAKRKVGRIKATVYPSLYKKLLYQIGVNFDDSDRLIACRRYRAFIVAIIERVGDQIGNSEWNLENRAEQFPFSVWFGAVSTTTWNYFPENIKELLIRYISEEKDERRQRFIFNIVQGLIDNDVFEEKFMSRFNVYLDELTFEAAIEYYQTDYKLERVVRELKTYSFDRQNKVINFFKTEKGEEFLTDLEQLQLFWVGRLIQESERNGSWATGNYISSLLKTPSNDQLDLLGGVMFGHFISSTNQLRTDIDFKKIDKLLTLLDDHHISFVKDQLQRSASSLDPNEINVTPIERSFDRYKQSLVDQDNEHLSVIEGLLTPFITEE